MAMYIKTELLVSDEECEDEPDVPEEITVMKTEIKEEIYDCDVTENQSGSLEERVVHEPDQFLSNEDKPNLVLVEGSPMESQYCDMKVSENLEVEKANTSEDGSFEFAEVKCLTDHNAVQPHNPSVEEKSTSNEDSFVCGFCKMGIVGKTFYDKHAKICKSKYQRSKTGTPQQIAAAAYIFIHYSIVNKKKRKAPRWWVSKLYANREQCSGTSLLAELNFQPVSGLYKNFTRMHPTDFAFLLSSIMPKIEKQDTTFRKAIPAQERLALTLRFLATGDSYTSLQYLFKISKQAISRIVPEVCGAIVEALKYYIQIPKAQEEWMEVAEEFGSKWNIPHCVGAIDGKHITVHCPIKSGSEYINYKGFFSVVLFALVDANYNFMCVDVVYQGRVSDGGIFSNTELYKRMEQKRLKLPEPTPLNGREKDLPFFFVGDEAFAMRENLIKVYPGYYPKGSKQRIFNYRLCRARRVIENVFGIVSSVFRVLRKPLLLEPEKASLIVMTVVLLHNFLRRRPHSVELYTPHGTFDSEESGIVRNGSWREAKDEMGSLRPLRRLACRTQSTQSNIRDELADYFLNEGKIIWESDYA